MPIYEYTCNQCNHTFERLIITDADREAMVVCPNCEESDAHQNTNAPSFKIKGLRAANGYGLKFVDTPGKDVVTGDEHGHSFHSDRSDKPVDSNLSDGKYS